MYFFASSRAASAFGPAPPPPPAAAAAASPTAAGAAGAAACSIAAGGAARAAAAAADQAVGLAEAERVAAAVLLGGALDVGDPLAELLRVGDRLAARDALLLDRLGLVEEPLELQLGLLGEALVGALVPDPDAHLEEADRVGVAEVEVLDAGLDERRHHRQLAREPALLGLLGHPLRRSAPSRRCRPGRRPRRRRGRPPPRGRPPARQGHRPHRPRQERPRRAPAA